ncbi:MAG: glycoside hydrolase family 2 protein [Eubacteriales bacterium]|nr:glycoside hydrolase family 2 protein [Eubacteriales bacterium]
MDRISLNGKWNLIGTSPNNEKLNLTANVTGCALNDIINSDTGKTLGDIFYRDNAERYQKFERYSWVYSRAFEIDDISERLILNFEKLDTYCDIYINEKHIAHCDNGFIGYKFDITDKAVVGENKIEIYMYSPVTTVEGRRPRNGAFTQERLYTRRMQCTYGWDWLMRFVTCGIGNAYIESAPQGMKISDAYVYTKFIESDNAEIGADISFDEYKNGEIVTIDIINPQSEIVKTYSAYCEEDFMRVSLNIKSPRLWNPNGYGESPIYKMVIKCGKSKKEILFGIRTVKIIRKDDDKNSENYNKCLELKQSEFAKNIDKNTEFSGFVLKVNDREIMCKGANWVPCEPFDGKDIKPKITHLLELAKDADVNFLRVWGGGTFECEHFYDECSRLGILVAQDFLMACGDYPDDEDWFLEQLRKEAEYATRFIRNKACLTWWCGDNENAAYNCDTDREYQGRNAAFKATAPIVYKNDPYREFFPSSPTGGRKYACNTVGMTHNTSFMSNLFKFAESGQMSRFKEKYKEFRARFVSEEPMFGAISTPSLKKFMADADIFGDDMNMWFYHTKNNPCLKKHLLDYNIDMAKGYLGEFKDGADRLFKLKYIQYEWLRISLEQARREKGFCNGMIFWMFNDCWPAACGWSIIDYYGIPKAAYYSFKRAAKGVIGSIDFDEKSGIYKMYVCCDAKPQEVSVRVIKMSKDGSNIKELFSGKVAIFEDKALSVFETDKLNLKEEEIFILEITDGDGAVDRAFYKSGNLEIAPCDVTITDKTDEYIEVTAKKYIHAVEFEGEMVFDDNYFSLLPNETRRVHYKKMNNAANEIGVCGYTLG